MFRQKLTWWTAIAFVEIQGYGMVVNIMRKEVWGAKIATNTVFLRMGCGWDWQAFFFFFFEIGKLPKCQSGDMQPQSIRPASATFNFCCFWSIQILVRNTARSNLYQQQCSRHLTSIASTTGAILLFLHIILENSRETRFSQVTTGAHPALPALS